MAAYQTIFRRYELKYCLDAVQYEALRYAINARMEHDRYWQSTILNLYYDTPSYYLIRQSLEKPMYKEKLRLRSYEVATPDGRVFAEIKKKYDGIVYKRRVGMTYDQAIAYLNHNAPPPKETQITREIDYFKSFYTGLAPRVALSYEREALFCRELPDLRITFDRNILWRTENLDLTIPPYGTPILQDDQYLMEIKIPGTLPVWLSATLDHLHVFPTSFSKYGRAYAALMQSKLTTGDPDYAR